MTKFKGIYEYNMDSGNTYFIVAQELKRTMLVSNALFERLLREPLNLLVKPTQVVKFILPKEYTEYENSPR